LEKKWEYNEAVHQLFIDLKAYDSVRREVLYNILIEFCIPMKLVRLIKMCLTGLLIRVQARICVTHFPLGMVGNKEVLLSPLLFYFALEYVIRREQVKQEDLKLNGTHQFLVYIDHINILGRSIHTKRKMKKLW